MELDDFKQAWRGLDRRLEQQRALNTQLFVESRPDNCGTACGRWCGDRLRRSRWASWSPCWRDRSG